MGAGGLQAMVKSGLPIRGKRVLVAGTGPLLLAVAAYLRKKGADIVMVCEQATWARLAWFGAGLIAYPEKIAQGLQLRKSLADVPFTANSWPVEAQGRHVLESVTVLRAGRRQTVPCDYLACGFHLTPNTEIQQLLGCQLNDGYVQVNELQETTLKDIFCVGEPTGIAGVESALIEGQIAGFAATGRAAEARKLLAVRAKAHRFGRRLDRTFRLRPELKAIPTASTIVCRCEDVSYSRLRPHTSWRAAKLQTRCGMGPCQGRVCGPATQFLFNWNPDSVRPPVFPARAESLAAFSAESNVQHRAVPGGRS
jgi:NADPH-dependent 2,4-dienoyl-CoA reductase/sulfur reductase-like enzyme